MATPSVIKKSVFQRLLYLLVKNNRDPSKDNSAKELIKPVLILDKMSTCIEGIFQEDWKVIDKMRYLCSQSTDCEINFDTARILNGSINLPPYHFCLIDTHALLFLAIAASRVGMDIENLSDNDTLNTQEHSFTQTINALARACGPAEKICQHPNRIHEILTLFDNVKDGFASKKVAIRIFTTDPEERSRWRCLDSLFELGTLREEERNNHISQWLSTRPEIYIVDIDPRDALPGQDVYLTLQYRFPTPQLLNVSPPILNVSPPEDFRSYFISSQTYKLTETALQQSITDENISNWLYIQFPKFLSISEMTNEVFIKDESMLSHFINALEIKLGIKLDEEIIEDLKNRIVPDIYMPDIYLEDMPKTDLAEELFPIIKPHLVITKVPQDATPGWIVLCDINYRERINVYRKYLRETWNAVYSPCLNDRPFLVDSVITDFKETDIIIPGPHAANSFEGGIPYIHAEVSTTDIPFGGYISLSWQAYGASQVTLGITLDGEIQDIEGTLPTHGKRFIHASYYDSIISLHLTPMRETLGSLPFITGEKVQFDIHVHGSASEYDTTIQVPDTSLIINLDEGTPSVSAEIEPSSITPGAMFYLTWQAERANAVIIQMLKGTPDNEVWEPELPSGPDELEKFKLSVSGFRQYRAPLYPTTLSFRIVPIRQTSETSTYITGEHSDVTVTIYGEPYQIPVSISLNYFDIAGPVEDIRAVIIRPAFITRGNKNPIRVSRGALTQCKTRIIHEQNKNIVELSLPFIPTELATMHVSSKQDRVQLITSSDDPRINIFLQKLTYLSLQTTGIEDAVWIVLLPEDNNQSNSKWWKIVSIPCARQLIITTIPGLEELLRKNCLPDISLFNSSRSDRIRLLVKWDRMSRITSTYNFRVTNAVSSSLSSPMITSLCPLLKKPNITRQITSPKLPSLSPYTKLPSMFPYIMNDRFTLEEFQIDNNRMGGWIKSEDGGIEAIAFDSQGFRLSQTPLSIFPVGSNSIFIAGLLQAHDLVDYIEIWRSKKHFNYNTFAGISSRVITGSDETSDIMDSGEFLYRIRKNKGSLTMRNAQLNNYGDIEWDVQESTGGLPAVTIEAQMYSEIGVSGTDENHEDMIWAPIKTISGKKNSTKIDLHQLSTEDINLRMVIRYKWHSIIHSFSDESPNLQVPDLRPVILRNVGNNLFWAEKEESDSILIEWHFNAELISTDPVLYFKPPKSGGQLELIVKCDDSQVSEKIWFKPELKVQEQKSWKWVFKF